MPKEWKSAASGIGMIILKSPQMRFWVRTKRVRRTAIKVSWVIVQRLAEMEKSTKAAR